MYQKFREMSPKYELYQNLLNFIVVEKNKTHFYYYVPFL